MAKKVLFLDHADILGGAEQSLLLLIKYLDKEKYLPVVGLTANAPLAKPLKELGVKTVNLKLPQLKGVKRPFRLLKTVWEGVKEVKAVIRKEQIDLVHGNVLRASIYGALAAYLSKKPFVWHVRDIKQQERFTAFFLSLLATKILAISNAVKLALPRFSQQRTSVLANALPLSEIEQNCFTAPSIRQRFGLPEDAFVIANVGWLAPWKGQDLLLQVAKKVLAVKKDVFFLVVGKVAHPKHKSWLDKLKKEAQALNGKVIFTGAVNNIWEVMCHIDLLVHCAEEEPFGRVFLEAMACQKPVVAFAGGGADEVIADGKTGYLVPYGEVDLMGQKILALANNKKKCQAFGKAGYDRLKSNFEIKKQLKQLEQVYKSILAST